MEQVRPRVGVGVMILKGDQILLGLRNPNKKKASSELQGQGTWTMPGGKVEFGETLEEAARRELLEETNLEATCLEFLCVQDDITESAHYVTVGFLATTYQGIPKTMEPETILKWEWFSLDHLPMNLYSPSATCIKHYLNHTAYQEESPKEKVLHEKIQHG